MPDSAGDPQTWRGFDILVVSPTPTHPQDHGNRKRIYEICAALKRGGARIHFVHYPAEHDWRHVWPVRHEAEMRAAWDSYHLVAPTRSLHDDSAGEDHDIDEWSDPGLEHFLGWACRVRTYDMAIVNYTWMSFCFDALPKNVFRICDTHDVFGGRRSLLAANGVAPEFFHTTKEGEARGLARADLVWAIKPSEKAYFEQELKLPNCLTMLHAEPSMDWWRGPPSTDGFLRAGVIGARNNVNRRNLEDFLKVALPVLHDYMAPVKIVIAGGCSDDFRDWVHPNIEILGRVAEVADFYRAIDVAIAPMQFSTGLKIKVSEALASGAPLIAHAHAMEGYPTIEPLHLLAGFREMAVELARLAFDPAPLQSLAARSQNLSDEIRADVSQALEATRRQLFARLAKTICVVAPMEAFDPASLLHDHLRATLDYLRFTAGLAVYVTGTATRNTEFDILQRFGLASRVFADPALIAALGEKAPESWTPIELYDLIAARGFERLYLMASAFDLSAGGSRQRRFASFGLRQVFLRHDAIEMTGADPDALIEALRPFVKIVAIGASPRAIMLWEGKEGIEQVVHAPFLRTGTFESLQRRVPARNHPGAMLVLARGADPLARELMRLGERLGLDAVVVDPFDPATASALLGCAPPAIDDPLAGFAHLRLVVDLTEFNSLAAAICEAALRLDIPRLAFQRGALALGLHAFPAPLYPTSAARLFTTVARCAADDGFLRMLRAEASKEKAERFGSDAGWTVLWRLLTRTGLTGGKDAATEGHRQAVVRPAAFGESGQSVKPALP